MLPLRSLILISVAFFFSSCDLLSDDPPKEIDATNILLSAVSYDYNELPPHVKIKASDASTYAYSGDTSIHIPKEKGYYMRLVFDNYKLANASTKDTVLSRLLDNSNYRALYGKYRNYPHIFDMEGKEIKETLKHEGQRLFYISRNKGIDTVYFGPIITRPAKVHFNCWGLDSARQPRMAVTPYYPAF